MQAKVSPNDFGFPRGQPFEGTVRMVYQILLEQCLLAHFRFGVCEPLAKGPFVFLCDRPVQ
jgi:hypothetical protein